MTVLVEAIKLDKREVPTPHTRHVIQDRPEAIHSGSNFIPRYGPSYLKTLPISQVVALRMSETSLIALGSW